MQPSQHAVFRLSGRFTHLAGVALASLLLAACASAPVATERPWVASWGTAQQIPDPANQLPAPHWRDASLRQIVHLSIGGSQLRVRLSNAYGTEALKVDGASVALALAPGKPQIDPASVHPLTFDGKPTVMIPAGAEYYSDSVPLAVKPASDLAISLYFKSEPARQTSHSGARATNFLAPGNRIRDTDWVGATIGTTPRWFALGDVEVEAQRGAAALVAVGDSITDGYGVTTDGNNRWPDLLAARLRQDGIPLGVVNAGIGGGRMLRDGLGPSLASRFDRDVLGRAGVAHALIYIGVNDLGIQHRNTPDLPADRQQLLTDLKLGYRQLAQRARARGICVIGATITPYRGSDYYHPEAENESDRQAVNDWIRNSGIFDAVVDFDAALRDPAHPEKILPEYDSGDHLHPSLAGYRALADAVPLDLLRRPCGSRH